jgi:drug/metabolite transporter (DMT)-like permease
VGRYGERRLTALHLLVLGVIISGIGPVLVRESPVGPAATAFWRLAIPLPFALWYARKYWRLAIPDVLLALSSGLLLAADLVFWNRAILLTSVMEATVLVMLFPIIVAAVEIGLFGRQLKPRLLLGGAIAFIGTSVIAFGAAAGNSSLAGDLMALAAAVFFGFSLLISGRLCQRNDPGAVTFWVMVGAAVGALPVALMEPVTLPRSAYDGAYLTCYGLLTLAGYSLYNRALAKLPTTLVAISGYGQPVVATALALIVLGEVPSLLSLAGGVVVVAGLLLATIEHRPATVSAASTDPGEGH